MWKILNLVSKLFLFVFVQILCMWISLNEYIRSLVIDIISPWVYMNIFLSVLAFVLKFVLIEQSIAFTEQRIHCAAIWVVASVQWYGSGICAVTWQWHLWSDMAVASVQWYGSDICAVTWQWHLCRDMAVAAVQWHGSGNCAAICAVTWQWQLCCHLCSDMAIVTLLPYVSVMAIVTVWPSVQWHGNCNSAAICAVSWQL